MIAGGSVVHCPNRTAGPSEVDPRAREDIGHLQPAEGGVL